MTAIDAMHDYYAGQEMVAIAGALVAAGYLLIAWAAFVRATQPARSFAITVFVIAGAFMLPANVGYFFYVGPQSARFEATLTRNPAEFLASEQMHLDQMMRGFQRSYRLDSMMALAGILLATVGFLAGNSERVGIGLAVALCATTLFAGEVWSKHRAIHYREGLTKGRGAFSTASSPLSFALLAE